jgi:hypothetical protein
MGLSLLDLTPVQDTFHGVIPGQSSILFGRIDLKVSCGSGDNKQWEMLTFEVVIFDIGYNCILGRPFLPDRGPLSTTAHQAGCGPSKSTDRGCIP